MSEVVYVFNTICMQDQGTGDPAIFIQRVLPGSTAQQVCVIIYTIIYVCVILGSEGSCNSSTGYIDNVLLSATKLSP